MSDDDRFDKWLKDAARDYHRPPPAGDVPREAMWAVIERARSTPPVAVPILPAPRRFSPRLWQIAAGAVLMLGTGIGIGRALRSDLAAPTTPFAASPAAPSPGASPTPAVDVPAGAPDRSSDLRPGGDLRGAERTLAVAGGPDVPRDGDTDPSPATATYTVATWDHLSRAEALLTSFRSARGDSVDASLDRWARDLLADTRLLLDSPAADDSRRRLLLEDLELVLAQIVQLPTESATDGNLVRRSIERGQVLSRIRSTIPAGVTSGT